MGERLANFISYKVNENVKLHEKAAAMNITNLSVAGPLVHKAIYIASPPAEIPQINIMKAELNKLNIEVFHGDDLLNFLKKRHQKCNPDAMRDEIHDFISLTEMEMCSKSQLFIYSGGSSWSRNILMERETIRIHKYDMENSRFMAKNTKAAASLLDNNGGEE